MVRPSCSSLLRERRPHSGAVRIRRVELSSPQHLLRLRQVAQDVLPLVPLTALHGDVVPKYVAHRRAGQVHVELAKTVAFAQRLLLFAADRDRPRGAFRLGCLEAKSVRTMTLGNFA